MRTAGHLVLALILVSCGTSSRDEAVPDTMPGEDPSPMAPGSAGDPGVGQGGAGAGQSASGGATTGGSEAQLDPDDVQTGFGGAESAPGGAPLEPPTSTACSLPGSFRWTSTGPIIAPVSDPAHDLVAIKDPTVVFFNERWHVYASSVSSSGVYGMVYLSFTDWSEASSAPLYYMDQTPGFATYVAAPQLFYFAPEARWYLVFQSGPPMFSSNDDPGKPENWTPPAPFFAAEPAIITQNDGWLDFWVICDEARCHLFFSDDHGRWYRSTTAIGDFPRGFSEPTVVMQDAEAGRLFEACNVYKVQGADQYLALIEAFDASSNWRRYFRSWTAPSLDGPWLPLQDSGSAPFAGPSNVSFPSPAWANDISHGEAIRAGFDQTLTLDACDLRFLYQAADPSFMTDNYNAIPWRLGLLTIER
jgi:endo-1,4-beta-xylanase